MFPFHNALFFHPRLAREDRGPLDVIITHLFPILQGLLTQIKDYNTIEAAQVFRVSFKIFYSATMYSLPADGLPGLDWNFWFNILAHLLNKNLPEGATQNLHH